MKEEHRSLLAAGLSMAVLILWFVFFGKNVMQKPTVAPQAAASPVSSGSGVTNNHGSVSGVVETGEQAPEVLTKRETPLMDMEWTNQGARPTKVLLKNYRQGVEKDSPPINLIPTDGERPLSLLCSSCTQPLPSESQYVLEKRDDSENSISYQAEKDGLLVKKEYSWDPNSYVLQLKVDVENKTEKEFRGRVGLGWTAIQYPEKPHSGFLGFLKRPEPRRSFLYKLENKVVHIAKKNEGRDLTGTIPWVGIEDRYFLVSLISRRLASDQALKLQVDGDRLNAAIYPSEISIPSGGSHQEEYSIYLGPKERKSLTVAGAGLEEAVDYGWFALIAVPILKLLQIFHAGVKNWGLAVILLTLFVKILMNPLTVKSMKQMKEMQALQPKLQALKEKYKNDRQKLNLETMALFRTHNINPMGGCLPMVLQMPIYIALYKVLYNAIELYHAPFVWIYKDLAAPDPYFILPILLGVAMVAQQKLTPSASADPTQKQMMMMMPIMFTGFMLFLPMGLVLYIFVNTFFSVIQQWMYQRGIRWRDVLQGRLGAPAQT